MFIDIDEFVKINLHGLTLKSFIQKIPIDVECVRINWKLFGDNGIVKREIGKSVVDTFKVPTEKTCVRYNNYYTKSIVRTRIANFVVNSSHHGIKMINGKIVQLNTIQPNGNNVTLYLKNNANEFGQKSRLPSCDFSIIQLNHYATKSLSEFIQYKMRRDDAEHLNYNRTIKGNFYTMNDMTNEKQKFLNSFKNSKFDLTNVPYIDYWKGRYNIGDVYSDFLFNKMYDKSKLSNISNRKLMRFIGSEIPTKGWMNKNTFCCGLGWRVQTAKLDTTLVNPDNFCYTRGKISRQRVIDAGVKIPKDLPVGDSGLLASLLYKPTSSKKYDIGIIVHYVGEKNKKEYMDCASKMFPGKTIGFASMGN